MNILVTGAAGFIGYSLCEQLLARGDTVVGLDNLNDYYSIQLKMDRLERLRPNQRFYFSHGDLNERAVLDELLSGYAIDVVVNLAAQAGVRYSIEKPQAYIDSNMVGFSHLLEACRYHQVKHFVFASSSSVYGANTAHPFAEHHNVDHPVSLYAATKKANELMAHCYASLYDMPTTGLRFFTVYGPWGRPDMALFKFTQQILAGEPIDVYNGGQMQRDFTYVDDVVQSLLCVIDNPAKPNPQWDALSPDPATSYAPYKIYNVGSSSPVLLSTFIEAIEAAIGKKAICHHLPMQPGDVVATYADVSALTRDFGVTFNVSIEEGVRRFVEWYRGYFLV